MELFDWGFFKLTFVDAIDILLVGFLIYQVYNLIKGTIAVNIFIGFVSIYLLWILVRFLHMELLTNILDKVIGLGSIALIIVFQQEIRRFLLFIGRNTLRNSVLWRLIFRRTIKEVQESRTGALAEACRSMANSHTGALIVLAKTYEEQIFANNGELIEARLSRRLIETIFSKNSPLHDGAVIISGDSIKAAGCILPLSENTDFPKQFGLRHRAAVGITEQSDSVAIIISEETGKIAFAERGKLRIKISQKELESLLERHL